MKFQLASSLLRALFLQAVHHPFLHAANLASAKDDDTSIVRMADTEVFERLDQLQEQQQSIQSQIDGLVHYLMKDPPRAGPSPDDKSVGDSLDATVPRGGARGSDMVEETAREDGTYQWLRTLGRANGGEIRHARALELNGDFDKVTANELEVRSSNSGEEGSFQVTRTATQKTLVVDNSWVYVKNLKVRNSSFEADASGKVKASELEVGGNFHVTQAGNVGVGLPAGQSILNKLHIKAGGSNSQVRVESDAGSTPSILLTNGADTWKVGFDGEGDFTLTRGDDSWKVVKELEDLKADVAELKLQELFATYPQFSFVASVSSVVDLTTVDSPQYKALNWLMNNDAYTPPTEMLWVERYILAVLYFSTDGDNWIEESNSIFMNVLVSVCDWSSGSWATGDWRGVDCKSDESVVEVRITNSNLHGLIPSEIGKLSNLINLSLANNKLTGPIPTALGQLQNLQDLLLQTNELTGLIPSELGLLSELQIMDLRHNDLSGSMPQQVCDLQVGGLSLHADMKCL